jgi:GNAT superfamily N-acetyltransferase
MDPWLTLGYKAEALSSYLLRADSNLNRYCLTGSGKICGVLAVRSPWLFGPLIELIALFDSFRGHGIGAQIIEWVGGAFESPNIWATVSSFNKHAQRFYTKTGFEQITVLDDLIKPGWNEILLRKRKK